jgi:hypothetical protein
MRWLVWIDWVVWGLLFGLGMALFLLKHALIVLSEALRVTLDQPPPVRTCLPLHQVPCPSRKPESVEMVDI